MCWQYTICSINKLNKIINGNGGKGYRLGLWNCRKGLIIGEKKASTKVVEIQQLLQEKKLHLLCIVESDFHGIISRYKRRQPLDTEDITTALSTPGYKIILPPSWNTHGQARIILLVKEELKVKIRDTGTRNADLPTITCETSLGREKSTLVNFFYR